MSRLILLCSLLLVLGAADQRLLAQSPSGNEGKEFYLSFPANWDYAAAFKYVRLYITSRVRTEVKVWTGPSLLATVTTVPYEVVTVDLPLLGAQPFTRDDRAPVPDDQIYPNKAVRILAADPVVVYGINRITYTSDGILALPTTALGQEYIVASAPDIANGGIQRLPSQYVITAPYDNTTVTIVNSFNTPNHRAGQAVTVTMQKGDVYSAMSSGPLGDLTGTRITSTRPVAVLSGANCTYLPGAGYPACDHLAEMMTPIAEWGKSYHLVPFATRLKGDYIRVFAGEPNAKIFLNGQQIATLNSVGGYEGEGWLTLLPPQRDLMQFTSDKKIFVAQYNNSQAYDGVQTDPFFLGLIPVEQYTAEAFFATPSNDYPQNFINLVLDSTDWDNLEIRKGSTGEWQKLRTVVTGTPKSFANLINGTRYQGLSFEIKPGSYQMRGRRPFAGSIYGWSSFDSYGYPIAGGFNQWVGDTVAPKITRSMYCDGSVSGEVADGPNDPAIRSNLASVSLDPASVNYRIQTDVLTPGQRSVTGYTLHVIRPGRPAIARVEAWDRAGNMTSDTVYYDPTTLDAPERVDFGSVEMGSTVRDTIRLINRSRQTLRIIGMETYGYVTLSGPTANFQVAPRDTIAVPVAFTATREGQLRDTLRIETECGRMNHTVFTANVEGGAQFIDVSDVDFGTVLIDMPVERQVTIQNNATNGRALTLTGASGPRRRIFNVADMLQFPVTLQPGETRTITVRFDPDDQVRYTDTIFFEHDVPANANNDNIAILNGSGTFTVDVDESGASIGMALGPVTPTPVDNGWATIGYQLAGPAIVEITLVDAAGRSVQRLLERGRVEPGEHLLRFDASKLASGTYFCRMSIGEKVVSCPVVVR